MVEVCYVCLLSSVLCTTAGVRVMGVMISDTINVSLCEMWSSDVHMGATVNLSGVQSVQKVQATYIICRTASLLCLWLT